MVDIDILKSKVKILKAKYNWNTDRQGRKFIYVKPEEIQEYQDNGWEIKRGPRGGIRAYPPSGYVANTVEDSFASLQSFDVDEYVNSDNFRSNLKNFDKVVDDIFEKLEEIRYLRAYKFKRNFKECYGERMFCRDFLNELAYIVISNDIPGDIKKKVIDVFGDRLKEFVELNFRKINNADNLPHWVAVVKVGSDYYVDVYTTENHIRVNFLAYARYFEEYILERDFEGMMEELRKFENDYRSAVERIFGSDDIFWNAIKEYEDVIKFYKKTLEVFDTPIEVSVDKMREIFEEYPEIDDIDCLENLVDEKVWEYAENMFNDRIFIVMYKIYRLMRDKFGFSDDEAIQLARGYEAMRFWTGNEFKYYSHYIENIIKEIYGNHRAIRNKLEPFDEKGKLFFEKFIDVNSVKSWINFVQAYYRVKFGDSVTVYRGMKPQQVLEAVVNYWREGKLKYGGVLDSFAFFKESAEEFASDEGGVVRVRIPVENIVGGWINASPNMAADEAEIIVNKPQDGLEFEFEEIPPEVYVYIRGLEDDNEADAFLEWVWHSFRKFVQFYGDKDYVRRMYNDVRSLANSIVEEYPNLELYVDEIDRVFNEWKIENE